MSGRLQREERTIAVMVRMYCADQHRAGPRSLADGAAVSDAAAERGSHDLCPSCSALLTYASERLRRCPFGERKPTCARCTVHCYRPQMREEVRRVMRYAGPRMTLRHPYLALRHLLDRRGVPAGDGPVGPQAPHAD